MNKKIGDKLGEELLWLLKNSNDWDHNTVWEGKPCAYHRSTGIRLVLGKHGGRADLDEETGLPDIWKRKLYNQIMGTRNKKKMQERENETQRVLGKIEKYKGGKL